MTSPSAASLFADHALLADGWARDVRFEIAADGSLATVTAGATPDGAERAGGPVIPGLPNLHSHAFQRAIAGLTERRAGGGDDFWAWRDAMYRFLPRFGPEEVEAVATQLYVEMVRRGYTSVAEFHYLHHDPDGHPYADRAEMARRVAAAARQAGIGLTLLPVLYAQGGFGGAPAGAGQRRFLNDPDGLLAIVTALRAEADGQLAVGVAPHSLRAVTPDALAAVVAGVHWADPAAPVHIHIAEQTAEVEACIAWSGQRPVEWLLGHAAVDWRWCLVHATHMTGTETAALAASGAVAGLCPTTEANLGDGLFPLPPFLAAEGRFGIGSDSHISVDAIEELRWLEYGQRLVLRRRAVAADAVRPSAGRSLVDGALAGGAAACGRPVGRLAPGCRADLLVLDGSHPSLLARNGDALLDSLVFAAGSEAIAHVMVGGRWVVRDRRHRDQDRIAARYAAALARLQA